MIKTRPWSNDAMLLLRQMAAYADKVDLSDDPQYHELMNLGSSLLLWHTIKELYAAKPLTEEDTALFTSRVADAVHILTHYGYAALKLAEKEGDDQ